MKTLTSKLFAFALVFSMAFASSALADENEVVALKKKVDDLNKKLSMIESKLNQVASAKSAPSYVAPGAESSGGLVHLGKDIQMGGHIDVQWNNNFRQPNGATGTTPLRIFDSNDGSFTLNNAEIYFEKVAEEPGDAGFRIDIMMGEDAVVVDFDPSTDNDQFAIQQGYVEYIAPLSVFEGNSILPSSVNIKAGRFATLAGLEVMEGPDNWNISRSIGFGFSLPFTHTGVRTNFGLFNDYFDAYVGVNNGWDNGVDSSAFKTYEFAVGYEPLENVSLFHAVYAGPHEDTPRFLMTNVLTWDITDSLAFMFDFDWGNATTAASPFGTGSQAVNWYEYAAYGRYQFTDKFAVAYRAEIFRDPNVFRTGLSSTTFGQTITAEYKLNDNLIARGEFRHDKSNSNAIFGNGENSGQTTMGAQLLYLI